MYRTKSILFGIGAVSLAILSGPLFAQTRPPQPSGQPVQQYFPLTTDSLPQMLQQAGYQVQSKVDNMGPFWLATDPTTNKLVEVEPVKLVGNNVQGVRFNYLVPTPPGGVTAQQVKALNDTWGPQAKCSAVLLPQNKLGVSSVLNYPDSNPQELKSIISMVITKGNEAAQLVNLPPVQTGLAGTTWTGTEDLGPPFGKLTFQFYAGGKAVMIDGKGTHNGTFSVNNNIVTIQFSGYAVYRGTINGTVIAGQGEGGSTWNFTVNKMN